MDFLFEDKVLIDKAKKGWRLTLAKFLSLPVKIVNLVSLAYVVIAYFGFFLAILLVIVYFNDDRSDLAYTIIFFYIPFLLGLIFYFILPKDFFKKKVGIILAFILCNLIIYGSPLFWGAYELRYNQVEKHLQEVEYNRYLDCYCEDLINAYKNRRAIFKVTTKNEIIRNDHVGSEWSVRNIFNTIPISKKPIMIEISEDDILEIKSVAIELDDSYDDWGQKICQFKIPWSLLVDTKNTLSHKVYVFENRGRYTGSIAALNCSYTIEMCKEKDGKQKNNFNISKDSIRKYFFKAQPRYVQKYNFEDKPWEDYFTDEDIVCLNRKARSESKGILSYYNLSGLSYHYDEESKYRIK